MVRAALQKNGGETEGGTGFTGRPGPATVNAFGRGEKDDGRVLRCPKEPRRRYPTHARPPRKRSIAHGVSAVLLAHDIVRTACAPPQRQRGGCTTNYSNQIKVTPLRPSQVGREFGQLAVCTGLRQGHACCCVCVRVCVAGSWPSAGAAAARHGSRRQRQQCCLAGMPPVG